jgi:hypothetical protein
MDVTADPSGVVRLAAVAGGEGDALAELDDCVARRHRVAQAKASPAGLAAASLRRALAVCRETLGGDRG